MRVKKYALKFRRVIESALGNGYIQFERPECRRSTELAGESTNASINPKIFIDSATERFAAMAWLEPWASKSRGQTTQCMQVDAINCQHIYSLAVNDEGWKAWRKCDINSSWLRASQLLRWLHTVDLTQEGCSSTYLADQGGSEPHLFSLSKGFEGKSHDA